MAKLRTRKWDPMRYRKSDEEMLSYVQAALEDGDPAVIAAVLGNVARAKGMTQVARRAGMGRESLYKSLSGTGNPELSTVLSVLKALGLRLQAVAEPASQGYRSADPAGAAATPTARSRRRRA
jgi:probable addiction module antidote protein